ncbi:PfkB family carbohydrate kinase [Quadrisphaera sp. INWT6]|uniref:PfkB family carbohydrate kinase n=1 Tax=Quadrisphaera sp. INWT6 TaxID=2596917 RepID=UPI0019D5937E|nr:PfkB family carbohydrate kinase [Quadrisphaera sp. INWT6]MBF5082273.1 SIS domain-containing protein [Quadrisphaera sp. INWT6]
MSDTTGSTSGPTPQPTPQPAPTSSSGGPAAGWLARHAGEVAGTVSGLLHDAAVLDAWGAHLAAVLGGGGRLLAAGNGGSAAEAQHLTAELVGRFVGERRPLSAIALHAETSSTTAISNDYGADEVFARQVAAHGRPGDVLLLLSTSGRSTNLVRAAERGREHGLRVWAMTGPGDSPLSTACDEALRVGAPTPVGRPSTSAVQEGHLVAVHALCAAVDAHLLGRVEQVAPPVAAEQPTGATPVRAASPAPASPEPAVAAPGPVAVRPAAAAGRRRRVVVVGDAMLDRDLAGRSERLAPDAPVPVVDLQTTTESPGGAGLTALLVAEGSAGARPGTAPADVVLVAPLADDDAGRRLRASLEQAASPVAVVALGHRGGTRTKTRVRVAGQALLRLDDGGPGAPEPLDAAARERLDEVLASADVVLVSDYGAGTTSDPSVRAALATAARRVPVVWDPHPRGGAPVAGCALVTPNLAEARGAGGPGRADDLAGALARGWQVRGVCVTTGADGAWLGTDGGDPLFVPAPAVSGGDPCGAGDRFAASAALALAGGAVLSEAVVRAVGDASAWVAAGGAGGWREAQAAAAPPVALVLPGQLPGQLPGESSGAATGAREPHEAETGEQVLARVRAAGGTVVATGGCFDVLHAGHVACLQAARRLGDALVVLLNSDGSVRRLKGPQRPVNDELDRARVLAALDCVDAVVVFDEDDPRAALADLRPDVWAKGGDYGAAELPEAPLVRSWGGRVVLLPYLDGRSTTSILARGAAPAATPGGGAPEHQEAL